MSGLADAEAALVAQLVEAGLPATSTMPDLVAPPIVIVDAAEPWLTPAESFDGDVTMHLDLFAIVDKAPLSEAAVTLADMVSTALANAGDWEIQSVSAPYTNGLGFLTAKITAQLDLTP